VALASSVVVVVVVVAAEDVLAQDATRGSNRAATADAPPWKDRSSSDGAGKEQERQAADGARGRRWAEEEDEGIRRGAEAGGATRDAAEEEEQGPSCPGGAGVGGAALMFWVAGLGCTAVSGRVAGRARNKKRGSAPRGRGVLRVARARSRRGEGESKGDALVQSSRLSECGVL
jgi:hypothetical protein